MFLGGVASEISPFSNKSLLMRIWKELRIWAHKMIRIVVTIVTERITDFWVMRLILSLLNLWKIFKCVKKKRPEDVWWEDGTFFVCWNDEVFLLLIILLFLLKTNFINALRPCFYCRRFVIMMLSELEKKKEQNKVVAYTQSPSKSSSIPHSFLIINVPLSTHQTPYCANNPALFGQGVTSPGMAPLHHSIQHLWLPHTLTFQKKNTIELAFSSLLNSNKTIWNLQLLWWRSHPMLQMGCR